jgi:hypothetical protein
MREMKKIDLIHDFTSEEKMTRIGGERLRKMILEETPVELVFSSRPIASVSFLDEGIAKLIFEGWTIEDLKVKLVLTGIHPRDKKILDELIKERMGRKP